MWMIWRPRRKGIGVDKDVEAGFVGLYDVRMVPKVFGRWYFDALGNDEMKLFDDTTVGTRKA